MGEFKLIAIGTSAGGVSAIQAILNDLKPNFSIPIVIVQHLPKTTRMGLDQVYLGPKGTTTVEVEDKMPIRNSTIYLATPNYHLLLENDLTFSLSQDETHEFSRPSIDLLFHSVATVLGARSAGVLLTGANRDGSEGLRQLSLMGGVTLVQSPEEAEFPYMPQSGLDKIKPDKVGSLKEIAKCLNDLNDGHWPQRSTLTQLDLA
jgi:two-component system, chemotaxis family, protein-glutamate methylesterase/glutaminase